MFQTSIRGYGGVYDDLTEIMQYEEELRKSVRLKSMVIILQYNAESVQDLLIMP